MLILFIEYARVSEIKPVVEFESKNKMVTRRKQEVEIKVNTSKGVELYQIEVWDDSIDRLELQMKSK